MDKVAWWEQGWYLERVGEEFGLLVLEDGSKLKLRMHRETSEEVLELLLGDVDYQSLSRVMAGSGRGMSPEFLDVLVGTDSNPADVLWVLYQLGHVAFRAERVEDEYTTKQVFYYVPEHVHKEIRESLEEKVAERGWGTIL